ncbi:hypothetical protein PPTG_05348 [Phytophthora nicotianae INRA-310]|uniref:Uncharacterized protein n=3 Tax=Phytophthora nicotianae TaxID=4792 RepID=W2QYN6_PHYN3|nr:hypothetical protein PPTG_05348 [Phytophthora nicotianae INRA-310]ETN17569.1 hypothetical protein PPTG_05348 [Phytophthora nicotianae INRA-310]
MSASNFDIDERTFFVLPDEELPERHRRSKRLTPEIIFLAAVDRPRDSTHEEYYVYRPSRHQGVLLKEVIPKIKRKWPARDRDKPILIQHDNAKPHVSPYDSDIVAAGTIVCSVSHPIDQT